MIFFINSHSSFRSSSGCGASTFCCGPSSSSTPLSFIWPCSRFSSKCFGWTTAPKAYEGRKKQRKIHAKKKRKTKVWYYQRNSSGGGGITKTWIKMLTKKKQRKTTSLMILFLHLATFAFSQLFSSSTLYASAEFHVQWKQSLQFLFSLLFILCFLFWLSPFSPFLSRCFLLFLPVQVKLIHVDENAQVSRATRAATLSWVDLNYTVPTPGGPKKLLTNINGYVKPYMLLALMGASGAGKKEHEMK